MADIITFRGGREAPEGLDRRALLAWLDRVRDQIDRLDGQEPEHRVQRNTNAGESSMRSWRTWWTSCRTAWMSWGRTKKHSDVFKPPCESAAADNSAELKSNVQLILRAGKV